MKTSISQNNYYTFWPFRNNALHFVMLITEKYFHYGTWETVSKNILLV